jgi:uncharacterized protein YbaP (TraB family)
VKIFLAGCLHLGTREDAACFSAYLPYYERASAVYFELMPGSWEGQDVGQLVGRRGYVSSRADLASRVNPATWRGVQSVLGSQPDLLKRVALMQPWLVALTLAQEGYRRAGLQPQYGLDNFVQSRAIADGKPIGSLEKPKDQILALADASLEDQERVLVASLENFRQPDFATTPIRRAWRSGDLVQLQASFGINSDLLNSGDTHVNLLARRNQQWVRKISSLAAAGRSALLVIGVEHLVTRPSGLPELLEREGFQVRRVGDPRDRAPAAMTIVQDASPRTGGVASRIR